KTKNRSKILEPSFLLPLPRSLKDSASLEFPRNSRISKSRIPYRDPPKRLGDDIVGNSRILKSRIL
ncbi:MAG: hypothetical protein SPH77_05610, partial [Campylobacter sp.]|uniref:hypothetical protein n=1 Tax=Campylobacter sp. TaxID=205 RepID=UPI002A918439